MLANEALLNYCRQRSIYLLALDCREQEVGVASCVLNETRQQRTERISLRTGGLRMAKTQGSIIELIDKNLRAWRSHLFFWAVSSIYAKICKKQKGKMILVLYCSSGQAWSMCNFLRAKWFFLCTRGGDRWVAKSQSSSICLFLTKTLKCKYCLLLTDEEMNFRRGNNSMLHLRPNI